MIKMNIAIKIRGITAKDLDLAFNEIVGKIREGVTSGSDVDQEGNNYIFSVIKNDSTLRDKDYSKEL